MVWAGVTSTGLKTPLIIIDKGVKINQHVYLNMLNNKVVPLVSEVIGDVGITLQQVGATSHTVRMVLEWCKNSFKAF